jgi:hypothetical protein
MFSGDLRMSFLYLIPVSLSLWLLGAHFFRAGQLVPALLSLLFFFALFIRHPWTNLIVRLALIAGTIEWIRTSMVLVIARQSLGLPWERLVLILGSVILLTVYSIFALKSETLQKHYRCRPACIQCHITGSNNQRLPV